MSKVRRCKKCPGCGVRAATFFARTGDGDALYRCNNMKGKLACGTLFKGPHPLPLSLSIRTNKKAA